MRWLELSVAVDCEAAEAAAEMLRRYCYGGVAIEQAVDPDGDEGVRPRPAANVVVRGYLRLDHEADSRRERVEEALWHVGAIWPIGPLQVAEIDEEDWASAWKQHYRPIRIGNRLLVKPIWLDCELRPDDLVIQLDPGMAFGTGLHPTTQMCLRALETLVLPGMEVLDLGTGSGILAIAAARLGAGRVLALDVDPVAVDACRSNVAANGVDRTVSVRLGTLPLAEPQRFDLIVANIIARVIADLAPEFPSALCAQGTLIAAGLIAERAPACLAALEAAGFALAEEREGDWITVVGRLVKQDGTVI